MRRLMRRPRPPMGIRAGRLGGARPSAGSQKRQRLAAGRLGTQFVKKTEGRSARGHSTPMVSLAVLWRQVSDKCFSPVTFITA